MKKILCLSTLTLCLFLTGCGNLDNKTTDKPFKRDKPPLIDTMNNNTIDDEANKPNTNSSSYTGEEISNEQKGNIPFMAIIENSRDARPQSGLGKADIVFETMAEGGIPRFIALFQKNSPEKIGPIRSARPYFLSIAKQYNLPFAHCGGSEEALVSIKNDPSIFSINEIYNGSYFYRDNTRKAPHNLYTSADKIRSFIKKNNINAQANSNLLFSNDFWGKIDTESASLITLKLNKSYSTNYKYINGKYEKYMDGVQTIDKNDNSPVSFTNIIIQNAPTKLQDDNLHLNISLVGKGNGYVFSNGKIARITWVKKDENSQTELFTLDGNKLYLSKGNTIWHIVDTSITPQYD